MNPLSPVLPPLRSSGRSLRITSAASLAAVVAALPLAVAAPSALTPVAAAQTAVSQEGTQGASQPAAVSQGSFSWGIKQSFRNYLTGPIAGGHWTLDGVGFSGTSNGEDGSFDFTVDPSSAAVQGDDADLPLQGSVSLVGHGGLINVTLSNMVLQVRGGQAQLIADGRYLAAGADAVVSMAGGPPAFTASPVATFALDETLTQAGGAEGAATLAGESWIHENLNQALLGNYGEGKNDGDRFSLNLSTVPAAGTNTVDESVTVARSAGQPETTAAAATKEATTAAAPAAQNQAQNQAQTQTQTQPSADTATCGQVTSASAGWGIKQSFRSYLNGPIAMGGWDLDGVGFSGEPRGSGQFDFTGDPASAQLSGQDADIPLAGSIHMNGHFGALDITLSNMSVKVRGTRAQFIADYRSSTVSSFSPGAAATGADTGSQVAIAEFTLDQPIAATGAGTVNLSGPGYITAEGNTAFGGNYGEGNNEADPLNVTLQTDGGDCDATGLGELAAASPATGGTGGAAGTGTGTGAAASGSGTPELALTAGAVSTAGAAGSADTTCDAKDDTANRVVDARMGWGVRESFRSYISGSIANGGWTTGGETVYSDGAFVFSGKEGTVSVKDDKVTHGVLSFAGTVNFTGHDGVLDTTVANPEIRLSGSTGTLVADVISNDTDGNPHDYGRIEVGSLAVSQAGVSEGILDGNASVTLTQDGSSAMGAFYEAGSQMDPLTFRAALADGCDGDADGLGDMPADEGGVPRGAQADEGDGGVTIRDTSDGGDENALVSFVTTPSSAIPSAIALIAVAVAAWFGVRLRRSGE